MTAPPRPDPPRAGAASRLLGGAVAAVLVLVTAVAVHRAGDPPRRPDTASERATLALVPEPGRTGASTCTDPAAGRTWRVGWRAVSARAPRRPVAPAGPALAARLAARAAAVDLVPTGFAVRLDGPPATGWRSADGDRWLLRWNPTAAQAADGGAGGWAGGWERVGGLAELAALPQRVDQDPRYVTPDGACTVYLRPFVAGTAGAGGRVAVVGDSLLTQVGRPGPAPGTVVGPAGAGAAPGGPLLARLAGGHAVEIDGQPGRRWTPRPARTSPLEGADATMLDELRGLRSADAVVAALGTNDAGWVALAPDRPGYELRLAWVLRNLGGILDELARADGCTVVTTVAAGGRSYAGTAPGRFEAAAGRINDLLRRRAGADPDDGLRLWDWAGLADAHGPASAQPWFGVDTVHLNRLGLDPYADTLARAGTLCRGG